MARSRFDGAFAWAPNNPVADAIRADAGASVALHDVAALHYALDPASAFFTVSDGRLAVASGQRDACLSALLAQATAKPAAPPPRGGG